MLLAEKDSVETLLRQQYEKVQTQGAEIVLLSRALDLKMADLAQQMGVPSLEKEKIIDRLNNDSEEREIENLRQKLQQTERNLNISLEKNEELSLIRQENNIELVNLEQQKFDLQKQLDSAN